MVEAASTLSGLGFSPLDYVAMWSEAARRPQTSPTAAKGGSALLASTIAADSTGGAGLLGAATQQPASSSLFSIADDVSRQVELDIARLKAAAQQALRNRAAQMAAGGAVVSNGATYAYSIGPDGQLYATGVTLSYDTTPVTDNPQATIQKMQRVRAAALASSTPTAADYAAAATATQVEMDARLELVRQMAERYLGTDATATGYQAGLVLNAQA